MTTSITWISRAVVLMLAITVYSAQTERPHAPAVAAQNSSVEKRVKKIQAEVKRIESATNSSNANVQRKMKELPHWQFSGVFENSAPILLNALLTEGEVVREETYYLMQGKPVLVRVDKWWDVESPRQAQEPATREDFYCDNEQIVRRMRKVESRPAARRIDDTALSAAPLMERSRSILHVLQGGNQNATVTDEFRMFPPVGLAQR